MLLPGHYVCKLQICFLNPFDDVPKRLTEKLIMMQPGCGIGFQIRG